MAADFFEKARGISNLHMYTQVSLKGFFIEWENDLNKYITFTKAADFKDGKKGHYFVVGQEPPKEQIKNHITWEYVKSNKLVDYVDFSETDKIKEYIDDKGVTPYFDLKASN